MSLRAAFWGLNRLPAPPAAPTGFTAAPTGANNLHVLLSWTDNSGDETGFEVGYSTNGSSWSTLTTTAANATSYTHTTPTLGEVTHYYRVRAVKSGAESAYATATQKGRYLGAIFYTNLDEASGNRATQIGGVTLTDNNTVGSTTGKQGNAATFVRASSEYLSTADAGGTFSIGGGDFTVAIWAKSAGAVNWQQVISKDNPSGTRDWALYYSHDGTLGFRLILFDSSNGIVGDIQSATLSASTWYRCVVTRSGTNLKLYVDNGTAVTATTSGTPRSTSAEALRLGNDGANAALYGGDLDEVVIVKRVWSAAEIAEDYNGGAGVAYPD